MLKNLTTIPIKPVVLTLEEATVGKEILIVYADNIVENCYNEDGYINDEFIDTFDNLEFYKAFIGFNQSDFDSSFHLDLELSILLQKHDPNIKFIYLANF